MLFFWYKFNNRNLFLYCLCLCFSSCVCVLHLLLKFHFCHWQKFHYPMCVTFYHILIYTMFEASSNFHAVFAFSIKMMIIAHIKPLHYLRKFYNIVLAPLKPVKVSFSGYFFSYSLFIRKTYVLFSVNVERNFPPLLQCNVSI